jgi:REP element-mobilizing transposase RayT
MEPLYTAANCKPAYELRWSLTLFTAAPITPAHTWIAPLKANVERDGVRILEHVSREPLIHQFLVSTKPNVAPPAIIKSVKGRLQHLIRDNHPNAFRRNFSLTSVGEVRRKVVEAYVANQLGHHQTADPRVQERLARFQLTFPVDLSQAQFSSHGRYLCNLHLVLVHDGRWMELEEARLTTTRDMLLKAAKSKGHQMSRIALLADHLHVTLGSGYSQSPEEVALSYLNNLSYAHGMKAMYQFSYFVGTFGEYDLGAIRRTL